MTTMFCQTPHCAFSYVDDPTSASLTHCPRCGGSHFANTKHRLSDQEDFGDVSDHHFPRAFPSSVEHPCGPLNQADGYAEEKTAEQQGQFIALQSGGAW
jgi:hypothetical protein